jgi:hypothetical protein
MHRRPQRGVAATTKDAVSACRRIGEPATTRIEGPTRRDRSNMAVARFLDMPRRIAQERVPTASKVGSRDVTWASQLTPLIPFRVFSRVSRAPFLRQSGDIHRTTGGMPCRLEDVENRKQEDPNDIDEKDQLGGTGQI